MYNKQQQKGNPMNNLTTIKIGQVSHFANPTYRKSLGAHTRALAKPMHNIPFMGDATGTATKQSAYCATQRRSILWAAWKAQSTNRLPDDLSNFEVLANGNTISFHPRFDNGWQSVTVTLPEWQEDEHPVETILEATAIEALPAPCVYTRMIEFSAPTLKPSPAISKKKHPKQKFHMIFLAGQYQIVPNHASC